MSGDMMSFPDNWQTFVQQYQFADKEEIYTNGSMLIPSFRVRQMVEHYFGDGECERVKHGTKPDGTPRYRCSVCGYGLGEYRWAYCPKCGARIREAVKR